MKREHAGSMPSQTIGPFYHFALTADPTLGCLVRRDAKGEHIRVRLRVLDGDGTPVPDAMLEIWQADAAGKYNHPEDTQEQAPDLAFRGFGRLPTNPDGLCTFDTVRPGRVPDGRGGCQAAHLNVSVFARGLMGRLCTRVYFEGDPALAEDPVLALVPEDRRDTLIARRDPENPAQWDFEIHLQGDHETVFFDI